VPSFTAFAHCFSLFFIAQDQRSERCSELASSLQGSSVASASTHKSRHHGRPQRRRRAAIKDETGVETRRVSDSQVHGEFPPQPQTLCRTPISKRADLLPLLGIVMKSNSMASMGSYLELDFEPIFKVGKNDHRNAEEEPTINKHFCSEAT